MHDILLILSYVPRAVPEPGPTMSLASQSGVEQDSSGMRA